MGLRWGAGVSVSLGFALALVACGDDHPPAADGDNGEGGILPGTGTTRPDGGDASADGAAGRVAKQVVVGKHHACALTTAGAVYCWGDNAKDQLATADIDDRAEPGLVDVPVASALTAGSDHTCALAGTDVWCWGDNAVGQLGNGTKSATPVPVKSHANVASVTAGDQTTCVVTTTGAAYCWGHNSLGQVGDGSQVDRPSPTAVTGLGANIASISPGGDHTCAVTTAGGVSCWGDNTNGALGNGTQTSSLTYVVSELETDVAALASGIAFSCARMTDGSAQCWGYGGKGALGGGVADTFEDPQPVPALAAITSLAAGTTHVCAVASAKVSCWGDNTYGQIGNGTTDGNVLSPSAVAVTDPASVAAGGFTCAVTKAGAVMCWGSDNDYGELGDGTLTPRATPAPVVSFP